MSRLDITRICCVHFRLALGLARPNRHLGNASGCVLESTCRRGALPASGSRYSWVHSSRDRRWRDTLRGRRDSQSHFTISTQPASVETREA